MNLKTIMLLSSVFCRKASSLAVKTAKELQEEQLKLKFRKNLKLNIFAKNAKELSKEELSKLHKLTLGGKSMMTGYLQSVEIGMPSNEGYAIIGQDQSTGLYAGWALLQLHLVNDKYIPSIDVFIDHSYRNEGIGSQLIDRARSILSGIKIFNGKEVSDKPVVGAWDKVSRSFYAKHNLEGDIDKPIDLKQEKIESKPSSEFDDVFSGLMDEIDAFESKTVEQPKKNLEQLTLIN